MIGYKKIRLGTRLVEGARSGGRYRDAHVFLGGTGAVGGTALLQMLSMYEEMMAISPPGDDDVPVLLATGRFREEIHAFTKRLFRFVESRHGRDRLPVKVRSGYLTRSGVFIDLARFQVTALPGLEKIKDTPAGDRPALVSAYLESLGCGKDPDPARAFDAMSEAISRMNPFSSFFSAVRMFMLRSAVSECRESCCPRNGCVSRTGNGGAAARRSRPVVRPPDADDARPGGEASVRQKPRGKGAMGQGRGLSEKGVGQRSGS